MGSIVFGYSVTFEFVGRSLVVREPIDLPFLLLFFSVIPFISLIVLFMSRYRPYLRQQLREKKRSIFVFCLLYPMIALLFMNGFTLTFDSDHGTATVTQFYFLHTHTDHYPLDAIGGATVENSSKGSSAINLVVGEGHRIPLSFYNQQPGKDEAVYQINRFLGRGQQN